MTVTDTLARDNGNLDINTGTIDTPVWTPVGGLNNWSPSPSVNRADTTKFAQNGRQSHLPASIGYSFTFSGFRQVDESTGNRDAGQLACEALMTQLGPDGLTTFRHSRAGGKVSTFLGSCVVTDGGGGNDDPDAWSVEITVSGDITTSAPMDLPDAVTSVTGTGGTGEAEITWTNGSEVGTLFEVRIFLDDLPSKTVYASEKPVLVQLAADTGYSAQVRAQNAQGWGPLSTVSGAFTVS